jgi:hypothetical protein
MPLKVGRVSPLRAVCALPNCGAPYRFMVPMHANERKLTMNRPSHRIVAWLGKAALKAHALQTLRDRRASSNRAKRLECVRFIGALSPCTAQFPNPNDESGDSTPAPFDIRAWDLPGHLSFVIGHLNLTLAFRRRVWQRCA